MARQLMPRAELEPRPGDIPLDEEQFSQLSLFTQLQRKVSLEKYPGALRLRHYQKGEVICRQGEAGWTAFYILTSQDALTIQKSQRARTPNGDTRPLDAEIARLEQRISQLGQAPPEDDIHTMVTVYVAVARKPKSTRGPLERLLRPKVRPQSAPVRNPADKTVYIPIDGPVTVNYQSLRATMGEGELFGEMSCLYRTPRSATIVARRDCYLVEILRNILDQIQRDPAYKARSAEVYKKRSLELQIRQLPIFNDLSDEEYSEVQDNVELLSFDPGSLICDEFEHSDSLYIVRSGLVKVIKNVSWLLAVSEVRDWKGLASQLASVGAGSGSDGRKPEEGPPDAGTRTALSKMRSLFPEHARKHLQKLRETGSLERLEQLEVVHALNDLIKTPGVVDHPELEAFLKTPPFSLRSEELFRVREPLKKKRSDWSDTQLRRCNRLLLDALLPGILKPRWNKELPLPAEGEVGPEVILTYLSRGDYFGEIGLMEGRPRSATCVAYGHPNDYGQVEVVRLPGRTFWKLLRTSASLREKVKQEVSKRRARTMQRLLTPVWDDTAQVQVSEQFEELGLIQGQRLMLIDLDRCTRCDECVKACVHTHDDGHSRLFLDGPRFGKYLVPTSCRACLDPVCMIGCPVGSIHRGDNREIIIEDWCIGCGLCADECPYGSIQMHDLGLIPAAARGWRYLPVRSASGAVKGDGWNLPRFRDSDWLVGDAPFTLDRETRDQLTRVRGSSFRGEELIIRFRLPFHLPREVLRQAKEMKLEVTSQANEVKGWLNGHELVPAGRPRQGRHEFHLPQPMVVEGVPTDQALRPTSGTNLLAVQVTVGPEGLPRTDTLLQARLDELRRPEIPEDKMDEKVAQEITEKLVTERAVVCDLCSEQLGQVPACVNACPHDAAMRVDARVNFPMR
jgi:CRP-like cAMP-binding protein